MLMRIGWRMWRNHDLRLLWKIGWSMGFHGMRAIGAFKRRLRKGVCFPPFVFISVTNACNLECQGCWVHQSSPPVSLEPEALNFVIEACKSQGNRFFGILGGEPLCYPPLNDVLAKHSDCYFQVFTNGTVVTEKTAEEWSTLR